jgi:hypothetical protein
MNQPNLRHANMICALLVSLFWIGLSTLDAQAQEVEWLKQAAGNNMTGAYTAIDSNNNVYVTGVFHDTTAVGDRTLTSAGDDDIWIAKYDSHGNPLWAHEIGGLRRDVVGGIAVDSSGNSYITGQFRLEIRIGTTTLTTAGFWWETFIVKYDTDGNIVWIKQISGIDSTRNAFDRPISVNPEGDVYLAGNFSGTIIVGTETLTATDYLDLFIAKFDTGGNFGWVTQVDDEGQQAVTAIANHDGKVYITGSFQATATFGTTPITSAGGSDIFLVALDNEGTPLWAKRAGSLRDDSSLDMTVDEEGNLYVSGRFQGTADFGPFEVTSVPSFNNDGFLAKYDSAGTPLWVEGFGGDSSESGNKVSLDGNGNPYIIGYTIAGDLTFGSLKVTADGFTNIYIARYDKTDGRAIWVTLATSRAISAPYGLDVTSDGFIYVTGRYDNDITFGSLTLTGNGSGHELFMARLLPGHWDDLIFRDGFEIGNFSAWTNYSSDYGDLSVTPAAALVGDLGLNVLLDDNVTIGMRDEVPVHESRYRARFYFDPNSLAMGQDENHVIFFGYSGDDLRRPVLRLELRYHDGSYQLRSALFNDATTWRNSGWLNISDAPHMVELDWQAATSADANNGSLNTWIDEVSRSMITGVDNDTRHIDTTRLGAIAGIDALTHGTYFFDAFESRRQEYIGAAPSVTAAMAEAAAVTDPNEISAWTESDESEPEEAALLQEVLAYADQVEQEEAQEETQAPQLFLPWTSH